MTPQELNARLAALVRVAFKPAFRGSCAGWVGDNVNFHEPGREGRFSFYSREYLREPLDFYSDPADTDMVLCFGTQTGKTTVMYSGMVFRMWERARRCLFVKPAAKSTGGAENDARTRFVPMLRTTDATRVLIPSGIRRHDFKTAQQILLNGSIADWTGSNSPANLAGNSYEDVSLDEIEKFNQRRARNADGQTVEADSISLAWKRTGQYRLPKRVISSTPTLAAGRIWTSLLATDLRRRFVPCPLCGRDHPSSRLVAIVWSPDFTVLPKTFGYGTSREPGSAIPLAFVQWDKEARTENGWDIERVMKSAGYVCPHCGGRFRDEDKVWMDKNGVWERTQKGQPKTRGYHLPSMYSGNDENRAGNLAAKFLADIKGLEGPQDFINSKLAEAYGGQDVSGKRIEAVAKVEVGKEWAKVLTVDCQAVSPYFWYIVRAFKPGRSIGLECGSVDSWEEIEAIQKRHEIGSGAVIIDSGYGAKDDHEVYRTCAKHGPIMPMAMTGKLWCLGWMPAKSFDGRRTWTNPKTGLAEHYFLREKDPFEGTLEAGRVRFYLFEYARDHYLDVLERLRYNKAKEFRWEIAPAMDTEEYRQHMRGRVRKQVISGTQAVLRWTKRYAHAKDHLWACEEMQVAAASYFGLMSIAEKEPEPKEQNEPTTS